MFIRWKVRLLMLLVVAIAFGLMWTGSHAIIAADGRNGSLLLQPTSFKAIVLTAGGAVVAGLAGTLLLGSVRPHAGVFAAAVALLPLAIRGGRMTFVVQAAEDKSVFGTLAVELAVLALVLVACGWLDNRLRPARLVPTDGDDDDGTDAGVSLHQTALALVVSTIAGGALMYVLGQSDDKQQALAAVGISAYIGTWIACSIGPARAAVMSWLSPLVIGVIGYVLATSMPGDWRVGFVRQPLTTATPLDYASVGVLAAVWSYWSNRRWATDAEYEDDPPTAQPAPATAAVGTAAIPNG